MSTSIVCPANFLIIRRSGTTWYFKYGEIFYNESEKSTPEHDRERIYGITKNKIVVELFRLEGGKPGHYLADLKRKKYYYCGSNWEDVGVKLKQLGIGRDEPNYS